MYTCLLVYIHTTCVGVSGGQKWVWKLLELELYEAASHLVWVLGTELVSFARATNAPKHRALYVHVYLHMCTHEQERGP